METKATKFHPILFSTPMVQAILEGRKTQTRRVVKYPLQLKGWLVSIGESENPPPIEFCPYEVGDVLWLRETFEYFESTYNPHGTTDDKNSSVKIQFVADNKISNEISVTKIQALKALVKIEKGKLEKPIYNPSIFMPKEACRTFLKIKSIRVERLQDISEEDSIAEGVIKEKNGQWKNYLVPQTFWTYAKYSFETLWISINGKESMNKNPFVWVYQFQQIEKPLDFI